MNDIKTIVQTSNVKTAVIVDDAYDEVPLATDLTIDAKSWPRFFEDVNEEEKKLLAQLFPNFGQLRGDQLSGSDEFISVLWKEQSKFRPEVIGPLFERFKNDRAQDLAYLDTLKTGLEACGIACQTAGRDFRQKASQADLIVIDLYLGSAQDDDAVTTSINGLKVVIADRLANPPLVILMSRSSRLDDKKLEFRDKSGLFESAFRIIKKAELAEAGKLPRILARLASHYADSVKLAAFLRAWQEGVSKASERTANLIRTLDLADHAQIQQLLLNEEGEPQGSYLVDVFDRVLQHEVEGEGNIIDAAIQLNGLNTDTYPPPYVAGSPDLQSLVFRSIFQNAERLRLPQAKESRVAFGDILRRKAANAAAQTAAGDGIVPRFMELDSTSVLAVLTPACDLQRGGAKGIMLLCGKLSPLEPETWTYADSPVRTPIIEFKNGERFWIKWDLKQLETIRHPELDALLENQNGLEVAARLREAYALELQQKLLSYLGRVGLLTPMPGTFSTKVEIYLPAPDRKLFRVDVPGLPGECGVCFIGRGGVKKMRLVICEDDCEAICKSIAGIKPELIHPDALELVKSLQASGELLLLMEKGISLPTPDHTGFKEIVVSTNAADGSKTSRSVGLIFQGSGIAGRELKSGEVKKAGIVLSASLKLESVQAQIEIAQVEASKPAESPAQGAPAEAPKAAEPPAQAPPVETPQAAEPPTQAPSNLEG